MTDLRQAAQQALEALENIDKAMPFPVGKQAITALREALAQPEQEPVRWQWIFEDKHGDRYTHKNLFYTATEAAESARICGVKAIKKTGESKVTTAPPTAQRKPLTDDEIAEVAERMEAIDATSSFWRDFARAIEAKLKEQP